MNNKLMIGLPLMAILGLAGTVRSQSMKIGEWLILRHAALKKDVTQQSFQQYFKNELAPSWNKKGTSIFLFEADRGDRKGELLLVFPTNQEGEREKLPTTGLSAFLTNPDAYTEYRLIGAEKFIPQPTAGILGIHYIKVKKDSIASFEKFVIEKLNPAVGHLLPDLQLLYFKAIAGDKAGTYLTIFVLRSTAARDKYWPAGAPETEALKEAFRPLKGLAKELGSYLVEDSYLKPESGGAAAYFESLEWTDFVETGS